MALTDVMKQAKDNMNKTIESTQREFSTIRTGRATPGLVEGILIDYYGAQTPLKQLASITVPDARLIVIQPWDQSSIGAVEKSILKSNLGITPTNDGRVIRLSIPQLSAERRQELGKVVKKIAEDGKVSIRTARRHAKEEIERLEKTKQIPEDEKFKCIDKLQELTEEFIEKIDKILADKEKEITHI